MAEPSAPPPYKTAVNDSSEPRAHIALSQSNLNGPEILALREQISDNAPTLFTLAFGAGRKSPLAFRINTMTVPRGENAGRTQAFIIAVGSAQLSRENLRVFVEGYPANSLELALRALLGKMEAMMGRMWHGPLRRENLDSEEPLLRAIDE